MRFSRRKQLRGTRRNRKNVVIRTRKQQPVVRGRKTRKIRRTGGGRLDDILAKIRRGLFGKSDSVAPLDASTLETEVFVKDQPKKESWIEYLKKTRLENRWDIYKDKFGNKDAEELEKYFEKVKVEKDEILNTLLYVKFALLIIDKYKYSDDENVVKKIQQMIQHKDVEEIMKKYKDIEGIMKIQLNEFMYKEKDVFKDAEKTRLNTYLKLDEPQLESLKYSLNELVMDLEQKYGGEDLEVYFTKKDAPAKLSLQFINYLLFIIDQHLLNLGKVETKTKYIEYEHQKTYKDNYKPPSSKSETNSTVSETSSNKSIK